MLYIPYEREANKHLMKYVYIQRQCPCRAIPMRGNEESVYARLNTAPRSNMRGPHAHLGGHM